MAACFLALSVFSCAAAPGAEWAGASDAPRGVERKPSASAAEAPRRLSDWEAVASLAEVKLGDERPLSLGHGGGRYSYAIYAPAELHASYERPVRDTSFPPGALLVERTFDARSGEPGPVFVMRKQASAWEFHEVDPEGFIQPRDEERCRRCHAEARADFVFGAPTPR